MYIFSTSIALVSANKDTKYNTIIGIFQEPCTILSQWEFY